MESHLDKTLNDKDTQGFNALYYAVYHGHLSIVKLLKRYTINYEKDAKGTSCLHIAIMRGHLDIVDFLLTKTPELAQKGADTPANKGNSKEAEEKELKLINRTNRDRQWEKQIDVDE